MCSWMSRVSHPVLGGLLDSRGLVSRCCSIICIASMMVWWSSGVQLFSRNATEQGGPGIDRWVAASINPPRVAVGVYGNRFTLLLYGQSFFATVPCPVG